MAVIVVAFTTVTAVVLVAAIGVKAMLKGRYSVVPGFLNWLAALMTMITPDRVNAAAAYRMMKN